MKKKYFEVKIMTIISERRGVLDRNNEYSYSGTTSTPRSTQNRDRTEYPGKE